MAVPPAPLASEAADDWLDLQAIYRIVRRRLGIIVVVGTAILLAVLPLILNMERTYSSAARVLIQEPVSAVLGTSILTSESELNLTTEGERLLSRSIAVRVISELGLDSKPEFNPALRDVPLVDRIKNRLRTLVFGDQGASGRPTDRMDLVVQTYLGHLRIARATGSDVVEIGFTSKDAELAALVPNTLVRNYLEERERQFAERVARAEAWLEGRIAEQGERIAQSAAAANAFAEEATVMPNDAERAAQSVSDLNRSRSAILRERAELTATLMALVSAGDLERKSEVATSEAVTRLGRELEAQRAELDALLERYGSAHGRVVAARAAIASLEKSLTAEIERQRRNLYTDLAALEQADAEILERLADADETVAEGRRTQARLEQLRRVSDAEQEALDLLRSQVRALRAEAKLPTAEIEVLSPASVPLYADGRGRAYYLAAALFVAGAISMAAAFLLEMLDGSVRSHEQLQKIRGVTPAGFIPSVPRRVLQGDRSGRMQRESELLRDSMESVMLALEQQGNGHLPQSILVTSALPGEGKTTAAVALAGELVASGREVLLVDADGRSGTIHERFDAPASPGFADYLAGEARSGDIIRHDAPSGISYIPRGSRSPRRQFDRHLVKTLVNSAASNRQLVIFDATPVLVANEALLLAGLVSRTLLVVQWGETGRSTVAAAAERLSARGDHELGVIINRVNLRRQALYGYRDAGALARSLRRYHSRHA